MSDELVVLSDETFAAFLREAEVAVLVEFTAEWCPPCRMVLPVLRDIGRELRGRLVVAQLDVDAAPAAARAAGVLGMPTMILYRSGVPVAQVVGARPKAALLRELTPHLVAQPAAPAV